MIERRQLNSHNRGNCTHGTYYLLLPNTASLREIVIVVVVMLAAQCSCHQLVMNVRAAANKTTSKLFLNCCGTHQATKSSKKFLAIYVFRI